jgi:hypothetical protein
MLALSIGLFDTTISMTLIKTPSRGEHLCLRRGPWFDLLQYDLVYPRSRTRRPRHTGTVETQTSEALFRIPDPRREMMPYRKPHLSRYLRGKAYRPGVLGGGLAREDSIANQALAQVMVDDVENLADSIGMSGCSDRLQVKQRLALPRGTQRYQQKLPASTVIAALLPAFAERLRKSRASS